MQLAANLRQLLADAIGDDLNSAVIRIYDGTPPADVDSALGANTLLAECTFGVDAFPASTDDGSEASIVANAITADSSADASGTASFARVLNGAGTVTKKQLTVTVTSGGGDLELSTLSITAGGTVSISSYTHRQPQ